MKEISTTGSPHINARTVIRSIGACVAFALLLSAPLGAAKAAANLVANGNFETTSLAGAYEFGDRYPTEVVSNWTTSGYNFLFTPGSADTTGATGEYGNLQLWGPNNYNNAALNNGNPGNVAPTNGLTAASPTGGNFIGADGAYATAPIKQTIGGLTVGTNYLLTFYWAGAQQAGFFGPTTDAWQVSFGTSTYTTTPVVVASKGFSGWRQETVLFSATAASQVLSFLAIGTPAGVPPFSLLDGVVLTAAPEPATWAVLMMGLAGLALWSGRRGRPGPIVQA